MRIKILLADDHTLVRDGLRSLIDKEPYMRVVGEAEDGQSAVDMAKKLSPNVVLMDVTMPGMSGIDATRKILETNQDIKVVALSMHPDKQFVGGMLGAGAAAYLMKDCAFEELADAIRAVVDGNIYLSPRIADGAMEDYLKNVTESGPLTRRERTILQLLAEDKTSEDIAESLDLSVRTVESARQRIEQKLGTEGIAKLTKHAIREGLTSSL